MISNKLASKVPQVSQQVAKAFFASAAASRVAPAKAPLKPAPLPPKTPPPTIPKLDLKPAKKDPEPFFSDDFVVDPTPVSLPSTPVQPLSKVPQPFANKKPTPTATKAAPIPSPTFTAPTPTPPTPMPTPTPAAPAATPASPPPPQPTPPKPRSRPATPTAPKAKPAPAVATKAPHAPQSAAAQGKELARQLQGRTPAQLLNKIAQLEQHNATLQSQLVYHSAVEAIYGESGFNQLRNLISEFSEEETSILKASGFESENVIHHLEARQRDLCLQFTQSMGADLAKHITAYVKKLKDQHRQSASAATATQQTLRNAGVPDSVISTTLVGLQPHLDELQTRIVRWEKLKADVDLLIATHSNH